MIEQPIIEIYNLSSGARDGMSGSLNFSVLLDVAKSKGYKEFDDLLFLLMKWNHYYIKREKPISLRSRD